MSCAWKKIAGLLKGRDKGTVAISFILTLPVLMIIVGVIAQYALLAHAQMVLKRAAQAGARSAMTALPTDIAIDGTDGPATVNRAVRMILESLSPAASAVTPEGQTVADALARLGTSVSGSYAARYSFAENATLVTITPIDANGIPIGAVNYSQSAAARVRITVSYQFKLDVPLVNMQIGNRATVGGLDGRYKTLTTSVDVQLSHGREAPTNGNGDPIRVVMP